MVEEKEVKKEPTKEISIVTFEEVILNELMLMKAEFSLMKAEVSLMKAQLDKLLEIAQEE